MSSIRFLSILLSLAPLVSAQVNLVPFVESINIVTEAFEQSHCAVQEGSLGNEISPLPYQGWNGAISRRLMRFSVGIENKGITDLMIRRQDHPDWFVWGQCHRHWHFRDFTHYELLDQYGRDVVTGRKQAFCLMDIRKVEPWGRSFPLHGCENPGISVGWADIYSYTLDGQWIDITDVPPGSYTLRVTVNYGRLVQEMDYSDNSAYVQNVRVPPQGEYRSGSNRNTCSPIYSPCGSNENCCSEICMHQSGEIKTSPAPGTINRQGGRCVCARVGQRCAGDQNCCSGQCDIRTNTCGYAGGGGQQRRRRRSRWGN